jgi:signal peptidase I
MRPAAVLRHSVSGQILKERGKHMSVPAAASKTGHGAWRETVKTIGFALMIALVVRVFLYQPFNIPSGSMKSTLLVGDYLFASKFSYGYSRYSFPFGLIPFQGRLFGSEPKRGDVVIFKLPRDNATDYIKRVIGLPGDEILVRGGIVYLNGQALPQTPAGTYVGPEEGGRAKPRFEETLPNGVKHYVLHWEREAELDNVGPFKVPAGHYFMMGDNRDDSIDSRVPPTWRGVGFVPYENLVGRAEIVFFSAAVDDPKAFRLMSPWTWPLDLRWGRIFNLVR